MVDLHSGIDPKLELAAALILEEDRRVTNTTGIYDWLSEDQLELRARREVPNKTGIVGEYQISGLYRRSFNPLLNKRPSRRHLHRPGMDPWNQLLWEEVDDWSYHAGAVCYPVPPSSDRHPWPLYIQPKAAREAKMGRHHKVGFDDKKGGYSSGSVPVDQLPRIPLRDREKKAEKVLLTYSQDAVYKVLKRYGPLDDVRLVKRYQKLVDIGRVPHQSESGIRTRRSELAVKGKVEWTGFSEKTASGRWTKVWQVK